MTLTLRIENFDHLADGGPLSFQISGRGFEVGRDPTMDWTLPDDQRFISSRHFEVRFDRGAYMLVDTSTNGTFVNGASIRVRSPHRLEPGDRLQVGQYLISVALGDAAAMRAGPAAGMGAPPPSAMPPVMHDIWGGEAPAAQQPSFAPPPPAAPQTTPPGHGGAPEGASFSGQQFSQPPVAIPPAPQPPQGRPSHPAAQGGAEGAAAFLQLVAEGAGLPPQTFLAGDPAQTARDIGRALRIASDELSGLLRARAATKQSVRSGSRTMIGAEDNNPMKFIPTPEERLDAMFGKPMPGFQRGPAAFRDGFDDVKKHQYAVHAAIQPALARLLAEIAPEAIEKKIGGSMLGSRKGRAWELFVERWDAMTHPYENGMLDLFLTYFAEAYDQGTRKTDR
ncbi:type VI secretion system-associated FHA domain protein TagH [Acidimangrovimonas sediminis]|uniref:type VI secretion system-associated FHA domain protein TagH n=1 Tax=Acidimangrovimonas sediminis TaxID=2056283 RepID=UPI000C7FBAA1|nr:type VI secretion system-associated FHA domain protein TagH [Acidimangrovimonas sediminis]